MAEVVIVEHQGHEIDGRSAASSGGTGSSNGRARATIDAAASGTPELAVTIGQATGDGRGAAGGAPALRWAWRSDCCCPRARRDAARPVGIMRSALAINRTRRSDRAGQQLRSVATAALRSSATIPGRMPMKPSICSGLRRRSLVRSACAGDPDWRRFFRGLLGRHGFAAVWLPTRPGKGLRRAQWRPGNSCVRSSWACSTHSARTSALRHPRRAG